MLKDKFKFFVLLVFSLNCFFQTKASSDGGSDVDCWGDYSTKFQRNFYSKKNERKKAKGSNLKRRWNQNALDCEIVQKKHKPDQKSFFLTIESIKIPTFKKDPFKDFYNSKLSLKLILCDGSIYNFDERGGTINLGKMPKPEGNNSPWLARLIVEPIHPFLKRYKANKNFIEKIGFEPFQTKHSINLLFNKRYENWFLITSK
jgi:hypothetical protein